MRDWIPRESIMPQPVSPDHDQRLKVLLKEFFEGFFVCFFPDWAPRFEFTDIDWLDKELYGCKRCCNPRRIKRSNPS
jgi:hypothetical protein